MRSDASMKERRRAAESKRAAKAEPLSARTISPSRQTFRVSLGLSLLGGIILWAAFPPLNWWPLAWAAPLPWLYLILRPQPMTRWAYFGIWLGSCVHWLLMLQGIRLAHLLLYGGWIALAVYLAIYLPLFIGLCRVAVQRLGISVVFAAPVVWVGLELARGYVATGFSAGLLSHSQTNWPAFIQIADVFGAYGVSFVMMLVAAATASQFFTKRRAWWPLVPAAAALAVTLVYGSMRLAETPPGTATKPLQVALIQGSRDVHIDMSAEQGFERMQHYTDLTIEACQKYPQLDLVIWPESMFALPQIVLSPGAVIPSEDHEFAEHYRREFPKAVRQAAKLLNESSLLASSSRTPTLFYFCANTLDYGPDRRNVYNSALLVDENGQIVSRYDKTHAVVFGEYVPFAGWFPWMYDLIPIEGMTEGDQPACAPVKGLCLSPNICFESTVPHLIRSQVLELTREGTPPDVLVNLTNDGWFHGSSILDLHLKCGIFRAIENRRPLLIAANTGISAHIDGSGRVLVCGPKRQPQILVAKVQPDGRTPLYHAIGDLPAWACLMATSILLTMGLILRRRIQKSGIEPTLVHESERDGSGN